MKFSSSKIAKLPSAILFDTDNTLYPYDPAHEAALTEVCIKVNKNLNISEKQFYNAFSEAKVLVKEKLGETASSHSRLLYMQKMLELIGLGSQVLLALDLEQTYWRNFLKNAILFPGVVELLDDIRLLGIPTAIVTDLTAQIQFRKIIYFGLDHFFEYIVTSEEAGHDKPHKAPFVIALEKMQVSDGTVWMIGDNIRSDIIGAKNAIDAVTLQKVHEGVETDEDGVVADATFNDFQDVRALLKRLPA